MPELSARDLLARLIAFDSVSSRPITPIADFVCGFLAEFAHRIERLPTDETGKENVVAWFGPEIGPDREGLILSGHLDVVPANEPEWQSDPFELNERDGSFVGRGTADMKGFVALALYTAQKLARQRLTRPLVLLLTCDEELGCVGASHLVSNWTGMTSLPRRAIIGEPTSLRVVRMHKGHLKMRITLHGRSAHSGYPHLGVNAIERAGAAIATLSALRMEMEEERAESSEFFPETPYPALNIATVHGGQAVNIIPDRCVIEIGIRVLPGMDSTGYIQRVREQVGVIPEFEGVDIDLINDSPPFLVDESNPFYLRLSNLLGQQQTHAVSYASDAGWLARGGLDCLLWGPGTIEVAHKPNESLSIAEFERAGELLERVVQRFCVEKC